MRLLVVCQHYWPEPFNVTDVCETLVARGHEVTVLTGLPNTGMSDNKVPVTYKHSKSMRNQVHNGVQILRVWLWPRKNGAANRVLNYLSFWRCADAYARKIRGAFDVVVGYQFSPVMQVSPCVKFAQRTGTPFFLYCFDLWPESLTVGGFSRNGLAYRWMKRVSQRIYSSADTLAVTCQGFFRYFEEELGIPIKRRAYIPQYAEDLFASAVDSSVSPDETLFPRGCTHFMFAGNIGAAQSVETIIEAARILAGQPCRFHIVGSGSSLEACQALARTYALDNVVFHGRHALEEMPGYYAAADAMLVTLAGGRIAEYTLPRKVQTYMAASKPILAALKGEGRRVIEESQCGFCADEGDAEGLACCCREFMAFSPEEQRAMGSLARSYYEDNFSKERFYSVFERELHMLKGTVHGG